MISGCVLILLGVLKLIYRVTGKARSPQKQNNISSCTEKINEIP